jgi:uncharacterized membrane protein
MAKINENELAKQIAEIEGKKEKQDIAQIKETLKITLDILATQWEDGNEVGVIELLKKHGY